MGRAVNKQCEWLWDSGSIDRRLSETAQVCAMSGKAQDLFV
jgi:hypothetical protein